MLNVVCRYGRETPTCSFFTTDVDSVTFLSFPEGILHECEEIHDTIIKTMTIHDTITQTIGDTVTKTIKDTVYVKDTIYINKCGSQGQGVFSVSADKQISFAKGNLQYTQSTQTWSFAEHQYDYIGYANITTDEGGNTMLADKIDLFDWGMDQTFVDWETNTIGTDAPNIWRTLSRDEWYYLFYTRTNAQKLFGLGSVNGVKGTIILPDSWTTPANITFTPSTEKGLANNQDRDYYNFNGDNYSHNTYTLSDWQKLEDAGAIFLPAAGFRFGQSVLYVQDRGDYWSSTASDSNYVFHMNFDSHNFDPQGYSYRVTNYSVRLVQDVK